MERMERATRKVPKPEPDPPRPKGSDWIAPGADLGPIKTGMAVAALLLYRRKGSNQSGAIESRWYYIGKFVVAFVTVNDDDMPPGKFVLHQPNKGNSGRPFKTERELHEYIVSELES
jgi:hypothetical protein